MKDQFNREISYMRISVTDRCNMSCVYCRPSSTKVVAHADILRYEEILRVCGLATSLGISSFKITGGEPLVRKGCLEFLAALKGLAGVKNVTLTTNGTLLERYAEALAEIGVDGVNISLDTCVKTRFQEITGVDGLEKTLKGIEAGSKAGLKMKLNCVPLRSTSEAEFLDLLKLAEHYNMPLRFIELMPLACNEQLAGYSGVEMRAMLGRAVQAEVLEKAENACWGNGPATYYKVPGYNMPVGFIEPIHGKFCDSCNRIRLTSTGGLKTCLYQPKIVDIRRLLRNESSDEKILQVLEKTIYNKPKEHSFSKQPAVFAMNEIGG